MRSKSSSCFSDKAVTSVEILHFECLSSTEKVVVFIFFHFYLFTVRLSSQFLEARCEVHVLLELYVTFFLCLLAQTNEVRCEESDIKIYNLYKFSLSL